MLKKTSAYTGLVIVTAAGALLTSSPAYALDSIVQGSHSWYHHRSHHRNHNWNGNRHHGRIFIRIYIYNKNNNHAIAIARPEHRRHRRDFLPTDGVAGGGAGGIGAGGGVAAADQAPAASAPDAASSNQAPVSTGAPADQGTAAAPATTSVAPLDEGATGNVSP